MLGKLLDKIKTTSWIKVILLPIFTYGCFWLSELIIMAFYHIAKMLSIPQLPISETAKESLLDALVYLLSIVLIFWLTKKITKKNVSSKEIGLNRLPSWSDLLLGPCGYIVYVFLSAIIIQLSTVILPWVNFNQSQNVGFSRPGSISEYIMMFLILIIIGPMAEELLFRGYLYGKLKKNVPILIAIVVTSLTFALAHFQWNVAIDVFSLSIILCLLREVSGSLWPCIILHMIKNAIAFYLLYINNFILLK